MINQDPLLQKSAELKAANPKIRARNLAQALGISEAELLFLDIGEKVTLLDGDVEDQQSGWKALLLQLHKADEVMALTRNNNCVHERKGVYDNIKFYEGGHNMGVAVNPDIDLRFFMNEWHFGFLVESLRGNQTTFSLQFFNKKGEAVHKIFTTPKSDAATFFDIAFKYKAQDQHVALAINKDKPQITPELEDAAIDIVAFQEDWRALKDTHDFFGMLRKYKVSRTQGLRLAPEGYTEEVANEAVVSTLEAAVANEVSIMCFVHSKGCIQIHTGPIKKLLTYGDWYNIMDPKFNLHLKLNEVAACWIVKKPTADGIVTSLELYDKDEQLIVYFFGERKPGKPELEGWRSIIADLLVNQ